MENKTFSQTHENDHTANDGKMDTIYRQAAIDAIDVLKRNYPSSCFEDLCKAVDIAIKALSAQSEIIRCKDCKHNPKDAWFGCPMSHLTEKQRPKTAWCWKGEGEPMNDEFTFTLNSPITEEQRDCITDVDFEHTSEITFHTKHGKEVKFVKASAQPEHKKGKWIACPELGWGEQYKCSECGEKTVATIMGKPRFKFCPMCGAEMRGGDEG